MRQDGAGGSTAEGPQPHPTPPTHLLLQNYTTKQWLCDENGIKIPAEVEKGMEKAGFIYH